MLIRLEIRNQSASGPEKNWNLEDFSQIRGRKSEVRGWKKPKPKIPHIRSE